MCEKKRTVPVYAYLIIVAAFLLVALWGSRTVTVVVENYPIERKHCFIIDAGHGGVDGGATSCTGKLESAFNLEISIRLNDLMHFLGYHTRMIRTEDISIYTKGESIAEKKISDLKERVRVCNETEGAILLSIHQNTFSDGRYNGAQVFYSDSDVSRELAHKVQTLLVNAINPGSNRKPKKAAGIYLMEHISCPGVLIECGFLSNPEEESKLRTPEYQKQLCCVIVSAAVNFTYPNT